MRFRTTRSRLSCASTILKRARGSDDWKASTRRMVARLFAGRAVAQRRDWRETVITELRVYAEGHPRLRAGFQDFLKSVRDAARARRVGWAIIMGHGHAVRDFMKALRKHPG